MVEIPHYAASDPRFVLVRASRGGLADSLGDAWEIVKREVFPLHDAISWDVLRVELWSDSGTILFFPARQGSLDRVEQKGCQVISDDIYEELRCLEVMHSTDESYDAALAKFEADLFETIRESVPHGFAARDGIYYWSANTDEAGWPDVRSAH